MNKTTWGGARPGTGPKRQRLTLSRDTAKSLDLLTRYRRALTGKPGLTEEEVLASLIEREWRAIDQANSTLSN